MALLFMGDLCFCFLSIRISRSDQCQVVLFTRSWRSASHNVIATTNDVWNVYMHIITSDQVP